MPEFRDLQGQTFAQLTALHVVQGKKHRDKMLIWLCRCSCGKEVEVPGVYLTGGIKKTCGCGRATDGRLGRTKHRQSQTPEYRAWINMLKISDTDPVRTRPKHWDDFHEFMKDMGPRPDRYRIATRDLAKPYGKDNNFWIAPKEITENEAKKRKEAAEEFKRTFSGAEDIFKIPDGDAGG